MLTTSIELLHYTGSLSALLQQYGELRIEVLSQRLGTTTQQEQALLKISENNSFIREVNLLVNGDIWVFARVVIPSITYSHFKETLDNLGNKSLGETLLFPHAFQRSSFHTEMINGRQSRFSVFLRKEHHILVQEQFLR